MTVRVTDETYPVICFQSFGASNEQDVAGIRDVYLRAYRLGRPILCFSDARLASHTADQRRLWADWTAESMEADVLKTTKASVILLDSALLRGALTALNWITPPEVPQHVCGATEEAVRRAREVAQREGIDVSERAFTQVHYWIELGRKQHKAG